VNSKHPPATTASGFFEQAVSAVDRAVEEARADGAGDPVPLLKHWVALVCARAFPQKPRMRSAATEASVHEAETRLGLSLPPQVKTIYLATDGLDWIGESTGTMSHAGLFPPLVSLALAAPVPKNLPAVRGKRRVARTSATGPAETLKVYQATVFGFLAAPLAELSANELQAYLALQEPQSSAVLLITPAEGLKTPYGSVVALEGASATLFDSVSHWLNVQIKLHTEL
jgi:hypothetical protein